LVFEIFDLKVADKHTNPQTNKQNSTSTDNKGPLKLALANQNMHIHTMYTMQLEKSRIINQGNDNNINTL